MRVSAGHLRCLPRDPCAAVDITQNPVLGRDEIVLGVAQGVDPEHAIVRDKLRRRHLADVLIVDVAHDARAELVILLVLVIHCAHAL